MNNVLVIIYPYRELNLLYNLNIEESDLIDEDDVIANDLHNISLSIPKLCNHITNECECVPILNIHRDSDISLIIPNYIKNNIQTIMIISYDMIYKNQLKNIINNINNNISILQLNNQKYIYDILKIFSIINNITINESVKEIIIKPTS
jgi:hypothetical protein